MNASERLAEITRELTVMTEAHEAGFDIERAHADADALLVEAIRIVWDQDIFATYQIENLLTAYEGVPKWYA